jgi:hypothetical protein
MDISGQSFNGCSDDEVDRLYSDIGQSVNDICRRGGMNIDVESTFVSPGFVLGYIAIPNITVESFDGQEVAIFHWLTKQVDSRNTSIEDLSNLITGFNEKYYVASLGMPRADGNGKTYKYIIVNGGRTSALGFISCVLSRPNRPEFLAGLNEIVPDSGPVRFYADIDWPCTSAPMMDDMRHKVITTFIKQYDALISKLVSPREGGKTYAESYLALSDCTRQKNGESNFKVSWHVVDPDVVFEDKALLKDVVFYIRGKMKFKHCTDSPLDMSVYNRRSNLRMVLSRKFGECDSTLRPVTHTGEIGKHFVGVYTEGIRVITRSEVAEAWRGFGVNSIPSMPGPSVQQNSNIIDVNLAKAFQRAYNLPIGGHVNDWRVDISKFPQVRFDLRNPCIVDRTYEHTHQFRSSIQFDVSNMEAVFICCGKHGMRSAYVPQMRNDRGAEIRHQYLVACQLVFDIYGLQCENNRLESHVSDTINSLLRTNTTDYFRYDQRDVGITVSTTLISRTDDIMLHTTLDGKLSLQRYSSRETVGFTDTFPSAIREGKSGPLVLALCLPKLLFPKDWVSKSIGDGTIDGYVKHALNVMGYGFRSGSGIYERVEGKPGLMLRVRGNQSIQADGHDKGVEAQVKDTIIQIIDRAPAFIQHAWNGLGDRKSTIVRNVIGWSDNIPRVADRACYAYRNGIWDLPTEIVHKSKLYENFKSWEQLSTQVHPFIPRAYFPDIDIFPDCFTTPTYVPIWDACTVTSVPDTVKRSIMQGSLGRALAKSELALHGNFDSWQCHLRLVGTSGSGKSTILLPLNKLVPDHLRTALTGSVRGSDNIAALNRLVGKIFAMSTEASSDSKSSVWSALTQDIVKLLSRDEPFPVNQLHKEDIVFVPRMAILLACNGSMIGVDMQPMTYDEQTSYWRSWLIFEFDTMPDKSGLTGSSLDHVISQETPYLAPYLLGKYMDMIEMYTSISDIPYFSSYMSNKIKSFHPWGKVISKMLQYGSDQTENVGLVMRNGSKVTWTKSMMPAMKDIWSSMYPRSNMPLCNATQEDTLSEFRIFDLFGIDYVRKHQVGDSGRGHPCESCANANAGMIVIGCNIKFHKRSPTELTVLTLINVELHEKKSRETTFR